MAFSQTLFEQYSRRFGCFKRELAPIWAKKLCSWLSIAFWSEGYRLLGEELCCCRWSKLYVCLKPMRSLQTLHACVRVAETWFIMTRDFIISIFLKLDLGKYRVFFISSFFNSSSFGIDIFPGRYFFNSSYYYLEFFSTRVYFGVDIFPERYFLNSSFYYLEFFQLEFNSTSRSFQIDVFSTRVLFWPEFIQFRVSPASSSCYFDAEWTSSSTETEIFQLDPPTRVHFFCNDGYFTRYLLARYKCNFHEASHRRRL